MTAPQPDTAPDAPAEPRTADLAELAFIEEMRRSGHLLAKPLTGRPGMWAGIVRLAFHYSIQGGWIGDHASIALRWCYTDDLAPVIEAFNAWDGAGEPEGWQRSPHDGRRRHGGNPELEYREW